MKFRKAGLASLVFIIVLSGCASVGTQQMSYLGEASRLTQVVGKSTHIDFAGIGVSAEQYAAEYNDAISDAFARAPTGTTKLLNLKAFRAPKTWPTFAGSGLMIAGLGGAALKPTDQSYLFLGSMVYLGGLALTMVNSYDFVVLGEPTELTD